MPMMITDKATDHTPSSNLAPDGSNPKRSKEPFFDTSDPMEWVCVLGAVGVFGTLFGLIIEGLTRTPLP